jgi:AcrR family transcriptional regulator
MAAPSRLTQKRLLDVTADLFAKKGYEGTSITDITDALKITRPTFYIHAKSKAELLSAITGRLIDFYNKASPVHIREEDPPIKRLEGFIKLHLEATRYFPSAFRMVLRAGIPYSPQFNEWWHMLDLSMMRTIKDAQQQGQITQSVNANILKHLIWGALNEIPHWYRPSGPLPFAEVTAQILGFFTGNASLVVAPPPIMEPVVGKSIRLEIARDWGFSIVRHEKEKVTASATVPASSIPYGSHQLAAAINGLAVWTCESHFRENVDKGKGDWQLQDVSLRFQAPLEVEEMICTAVRSLSGGKLDIWDVIITVPGNAEPVSYGRVIFTK